MRHEKFFSRLVLFWCFLFLAAYCFGQIGEPMIFPFAQENIVLLKSAGGFNFDNDEYFDVVGIAALIDDNGLPIPRSTYLVHLEESLTQDFDLVWRFNVPENLHGDFSDVVVSDIDGDEFPEIIAVLNISETVSNKSPEWLYIFEYDNGFSLEPTATIDYKGNFPTRPRPSFLEKGDINGDGKDDLIITSCSPSRGVAVVSADGEVRLKNLNIILQLTEREILQGVFPFRAIAIDFDVVTGQELVILGGEGEFSVEAYRINSDAGPILTEVFSSVDRTDINFSGICSGDLNGDGISEVIIPLNSGGGLLLNVLGDSFEVTEFFPKTMKISSLTVADLDDNDKDDVIIYDSAGMGFTRFEYEEVGEVSDFASFQKVFYDNPMLKNVHFLSISPVINLAGKLTGALTAPFYHPVFKQHGLCYWKIEDNAPLSGEGLVRGVLEEVDVALAKRDTTIAGLKLPEDKEGLISFLDSLAERYKSITGEEIKLAPLPTDEEVEMEAARLGAIRPDFVVHPGEELRRTISIPGLFLDDLKDLKVYVNLPPGMKFNLAKKQLVWVPADSQLGFHTVQTSFSWQEKSVSQAFIVYVNCPPEVVSGYKKRDIVQIGETFHFEIEVRDNNEDAVVSYRLIDSPLGAEVTEQGEIVWTPSENDVDWYDFEVEVSDGYESETVEFSLFVNHPVYIASKAPEKASVGKRYNYTSVVQDKNGGFYLQLYEVSPRVTDWRTTGIYEVKILDRKVRDNLDKYVADFDSAYPAETFSKIVSKGGITRRVDILGRIQEVLTDGVKLVFVFTADEFYTPTVTDLLEAFFRKGISGIPRHAKPVRRHLYNFVIKEAPFGMEMSPLGDILWVPESNQVDLNTFSYTISDGYFSAEENIQVYVNHPPTIISSQDTIAYVDELWKYEVRVSDLNSDQELKYELKKAPDGMAISESGVVSWQPKISQLSRNSFVVEVFDGLEKDTQKCKVFVDMKPRIVSNPKPVAMTGLKYRYNLEAEDINDDSLIFKAIKIPNYSNFDPSIGELLWVPKRSQKGVHDILLEVIDSHGSSTLQEFQVHVFHNPSERRLSLLRSTISLLALIGVIYILVIGV